jgi:hypothetical protein
MAKSVAVGQRRDKNPIIEGFVWFLIGLLGTLALGVLWGVGVIYRVRGRFGFDADFWVYGSLLFGVAYGFLGMLWAIIKPQPSRGIPRLLEPPPQT